MKVKTKVTGRVQCQQGAFLFMNKAEHRLVAKTHQDVGEQVVAFALIPGRKQAVPEVLRIGQWASVDQLSPGDLANGRSVPTADDGAKVLRPTAVRDGKTGDLTESKCGGRDGRRCSSFSR